jgi:hypothetical protein
MGIDEAGYGPTLGPFCHGMSLFRVDAAARNNDLWARLAPTIARYPAPAGALAVDDSKRVHAASNGEEQLAAAVRAFASAAQPQHAARALAEALLTHDELQDWAREPWGALQPEETQPGVWGSADPASRDAAGRVATALRAAACECVGVHGALLSARAFNAALDEPGTNKADLNFARVRGLLARALHALRPGEDAFVVIDRLGGRKFYAEGLRPLSPDFQVWIECEEKERSAYRFAHAGGGTVRVQFRVGGEATFLPVALASMAAKWLRELGMRRFNAHFTALQPGLRPTAGYAVDARRFLKETAQLRAARGIPDSTLIRRA